MVVYAKGILKGKYAGNDMFGSLLQAVVIKNDKERRGVGMQNFKYTPDLIELAHIISTHSASAYEALREFLPMPTIRTIQ